MITGPYSLVNCNMAWCAWGLLDEDIDEHLVVNDTDLELGQVDRHPRNVICSDINGRFTLPRQVVFDCLSDLDPRRLGAIAAHAMKPWPWERLST